MNLHSLPAPHGSKCEARNRLGMKCSRVANHGPGSRAGNNYGTDHWPRYGSYWHWS